MVAYAVELGVVLGLRCATLARAARAFRAALAEALPEAAALAALERVDRGLDRFGLRPVSGVLVAVLLLG
jgi:hypothetical protein